MFPAYFLDQLQESASIVTVVGQRVALVQRGSTFKGLCPFHPEKRPSFVVNPTRGTYHCFGCGAHGDVIDFVRYDRGLSFVEAVRALAFDVGLPIPETSPFDQRRHDKEKREMDLLNQAAVWFQAQLKSCPEALSYLTNRGMTKDEIQSFRLGWSPRQGLIPHMVGLGYTHQEMVDGGLIIKSQKDNGFFPRFRQRIIFPIMNGRGQVIAFGGRTVPGMGGQNFGDVAKYMNSPETSLFIKGRALYQPSRWLPRIPLVIVEGYFDVISMCRMANAVAPLGTAVTSDQLQTIWKRHPEPIVCFDGDDAGQAAQRKLAFLALSLLRPGYSLSFVRLPAGSDPFSLLAERGHDVMKNLLSQSVSLSDYLWQSLFHRAMTPELRAKSIEKWNACIQTIPDPTVKRMYQQYAYQKRQKKKIPQVPSAPDPYLVPKILLSCLVFHIDLIDDLREHIKNVKIPGNSLWEDIKNFVLSHPKDHPNLPYFKENVLAYMRHVPKNVKDLKKYWEDLYHLFYRKIGQ